MQLDIRALNFPLTKDLQDYVERRICFALSSRDEYIQRIDVHLSEVNGPFGSKDKCCHVQVVLLQISDVVIDDIEVDLYIAIDRAAERSARTVGRCLDHYCAGSRYSSYDKLKGNVKS